LAGEFLFKKVVGADGLPHSMGWNLYDRNPNAFKDYFIFFKKWYAIKAAIFVNL
jgi:hypothetical protein